MLAVILIVVRLVALVGGGGVGPGVFREDAVQVLWGVLGGSGGAAKGHKVSKDCQRYTCEERTRNRPVAGGRGGR